MVMISLISADKDVQPDALAALAASAALAISDIPFAGPISEVRVARIDGKLQINPKTADKVPFMDATDALAAAYCHFMQAGRPETGVNYHGWKDFVNKNRSRVPASQIAALQRKQ